MPWQEINDVLSLIRSVCPVEPLTSETHDRGILIAKRYKLSVYDSMIVSAALIADCDALYSEDMHDGLLIDDQVRLLNPLGQYFRIPPKFPPSSLSGHCQALDPLNQK